MKKLIEALTIFAKYQDLEWPTDGSWISFHFGRA